MKERPKKSADPQFIQPDAPPETASRALRGRAEALLRQHSADLAPMSAAQLKRVVHELRVHQIELEMQNEDLRQAQTQLAQARDRFSDLYDFAPVGYLTMDQKGVIGEANLTLEKWLGLSRDDLAGEKLSRFVARESQDAFYMHRQAVFRTGQAQTCEVSLRRADGSDLTVQLESVLDTSPSSPARRCQSALTDVTARKEAEKAVREREVRLRVSRAALEKANAKLESLNCELEGRVAAKTAKLRCFARRLTQIEERERCRVAYLLHEGLQQLQVSALFTLGNLKKRARSRSVRATIAEVADILDKSIDLTRTVTYEVYPPALRDLGLAAALDWLASQCRKTYGLSVTVQTDGNLEPESEEVLTFLFRAAQELLLNVAKHARTKAARVRLAQVAGREVRLEVSDLGKGFDPARPGSGSDKTSGFGLFSLRERVEMLGGRMEVQSARAKGSRIALVVPVSAMSVSTQWRGGGPRRQQGVVQ